MRPRDVTAALGLNGTIVPDLTFDGRKFVALVDVDRQEASRRIAVGLGSVLDRGLLAAMSTLPWGLPVSRSDIDPVCQALLDVAPPGIVDWQDEAIVRT